jgi:hypothetical protein
MIKKSIVRQSLLTEEKLGVNVCWFIGNFILVHAMKACRGSRGIAPLVLNLVCVCEWVNFTPRSLYLRLRKPRYPLQFVQTYAYIYFQSRFLL